MNDVGGGGATVCEDRTVSRNYGSTPPGPAEACGGGSPRAGTNAERGRHLMGSRASLASLAMSRDSADRMAASARALARKYVRYRREAAPIGS